MAAQYRSSSQHATTTDSRQNHAGIRMGKMVLDRFRIIDLSTTAEAPRVDLKQTNFEFLGARDVRATNCG
ncbi:hypothetical protein VCV18_009841 [Metarhizium anisopliae]